MSREESPQEGAGWSGLVPGLNSHRTTTTGEHSSLYAPGSTAEEVHTWSNTGVSSWDTVMSQFPWEPMTLCSAKAHRVSGSLEEWSVRNIDFSRHRPEAR